MPLPSSINDLSTTPASNSPAGSESSGLTDDYLRYYASYIASLRDVVLSGTSSLTTLNLAYTGTLTGGSGVVNIGGGQVYKDSSGNFGVGTNAPGAKVEVQVSSSGATVQALRLQNAGVGGNTKAQLGFYSNATPYGYINGGYGAASPEMNFVLPGAGVFTWVNIAAEQMRLDANGNLIIYNTTGAPSAPTGGGVLYVESGALKFRGSSGTITTIAVA